MSSLCLFLIGKILTLLVGVYFFVYLPKPYRLVFYLTVIALFCESYGYYIGSEHKSNAWLFNFYMLIEMLLLSITATQLIPELKIKRLFLLILVVNILIWAGDVMTYSIFIFANISMVCNCCAISIIYIILLFSNGIFNGKRILQQPLFWLATSTILYFACDIPYMGLHNYMVKNFPVVSYKLGNINTALDVIRYPLVAISFILLGRNGRTATKTA